MQKNPPNFDTFIFLQQMGNIDSHQLKFHLWKYPFLFEMLSPASSVVSVVPQAVCSSMFFTPIPCKRLHNLLLFPCDFLKNP